MAFSITCNDNKEINSKIKKVIDYLKIILILSIENK